MIYLDSIKRKIRDSKGYTLLFAVLTASLVLGVAAFIVGFSRKQFLLASSARESMFAIYSASSGIECAALNYQISNISSSSPGVLTCAGTVFASYTPSDGYYPDVLDPSSDRKAWRYDTIDQTGGRCAVVSFYTGLSKSNKPSTVIESRGYNFCKTDTSGKLMPDTSNPRIVERAIRVRYLGEW